MWSRKSGAQTRVISAHPSGVLSVDWSPDGSLIATSGQDHTVRIWDAEAATELFVLTGHNGAVNKVRFAPGGEKVASISLDATVRLWDPRTGKELGTLKNGSGSVDHLAFSPDGSNLVTGGKRGLIDIWDLRTGRTLRTVKAHDSAVSALVFSSTGQLFSSSRDGTVREWNLKEGHKLFPNGHRFLHRMDGSFEKEVHLAWPRVEDLSFGKSEPPPNPYWPRGQTKFQARGSPPTALQRPHLVKNKHSAIVRCPDRPTALVRHPSGSRTK